ncbi:MAG: cytochrome c biogenesis protein ResB, partial [Phaeodactylibacter sp.]|nr:cytochrome c biogenesis protein ResB [Phaeodactylibacter sp.]
MNTLKKILDKLFSTSAAGLYMALFAIAIGAATFVENDFGTSSAQKLIFRSRWMEVLMVLFAISILVNIFRFRLIQQKKWAIFAFHAAILLILLGAAVTRYTGFEGMVHIREGSISDSYLTGETYLVFEAEQGGKIYTFDEPVLFATLGNNAMKRSFLLGEREVSVEVLDFVPNPAEVMVEDENGAAVIQLVIAGANGREEYHLGQGSKNKVHGTLFNFSDEEEPQAFNIKYENGGLYLKGAQAFTVMQMATQQRDTFSPGQYYPLMLRSLYTIGQESFVFANFSPNARVELTSTSPKMSSTSMGGVKIRVSQGDEIAEDYIFGSKGVEGRPGLFVLGDMQMAISYGAKRAKLPFALKLRDFIMEKYPGTNSASSYASEVTLMDSRNHVNKDYRIYMNNILNYKGYRFFQSSFDKDELGTYLSINHDWWGTWISYLGYAILTLGMALTFFSSKSRFRQLSKSLEKMRQAERALGMLVLGALLFTANPAFGNTEAKPFAQVVDVGHAQKFGYLIVQDNRGRMKPMNTFASEILRKLSRKESLYGLTAEQIILGMAVNPSDWFQTPLIKMGKHENTKKLVPVEGDLATYDDFFDKNGQYLLKEAVSKAYDIPERDRGAFEKEIMKLDEKVNICNMVFSGSFMKVFPIPGDLNNHWESPTDVGGAHQNPQEQFYNRKFYTAYIPAVQNAFHDQDWSLANGMIDELEQYQQKYGAAVLPSANKVKAELLLNKLDVFS